MSARGRPPAVGYEGFVPALDRKVPVEPVPRAPMPQKSLVVVYMPSPIGRTPRLIDPSRQISFLDGVLVEIGTRRQQSHHQVGGFHHVGAIVYPVARNGL